MRFLSFSLLALSLLSQGAVGCDYAQLHNKELSTPEIPAPQLTGPANNAYVGSIFSPESLRPVLHWRPGEAQDPAAPPLTYQLEVSADASFASPVILVEITETSYAPPTTLPVADTAPVGQQYFWRVRACVKDDECSAYSSTWRLNLGRSKNDYDGDGLSDIVIGAPFNAQSFPSGGRAYVYLGERFFFPDVPEQTLIGEGEKSFFGREITALGDVNGDGFSDFAVSAPGPISFGITPGRVYVYFGGTQFWATPTPRGVLSGRGINDVFGEAVASGDFNADGFMDLAVSAKYLPDGTQDGLVDIYLGGPGTSFDTTLDVQLIAREEGEWFGNELAAADYNRDGFADLAISAFSNDNAGDGAGCVYMYFGGEGILDTNPDGIMYGLSSRGLLGIGLISPGDINGDNFDDLIATGDIIGEPSSANLAYIYYGGTGTDFDSNPDKLHSIAGSSTPSFAGDLDADGSPDLLDSAHLLYGLGKGEFDFSESPLTGGNAQDGFGAFVEALGDINGDGVDDVILGSPRDSTRGANAGRAYIYLGSRTGNVSSPAFTLSGTTGEQFGDF